MRFGLGHDVTISTVHGAASGEHIIVRKLSAVLFYKDMSSGDTQHFYRNFNKAADAKANIGADGHDISAGW